MPKRGSSRPASQSVTFATWGPPDPIRAGPGPLDLFRGLPVQPAPRDVQCEGRVAADIPWLASWGLYPQVYALGRLLRPPRVLEIGTLYGHGLCALLRGAGSAVSDVTVIDNESYFAGGYLAAARANLRHVLRPINRARRLLARPPVRVSIHAWDMADGFPVGVTGPFDLVMVDGDHSYAGKRRDLALAWSVLASDGHLYVDDVHSMPDVRRAVVDFLATVSVGSVLELFTRTTDRPRGAYVVERGRGGCGLRSSRIQ